MEQLRNAPIFTQLRGLVRQNPALLQPFLQELGRSNPELLTVSKFFIFFYNRDYFTKLLTNNLLL